MLQWIIYDSYAQDFEETERDKDKEKKVLSLEINYTAVPNIIHIIPMLLFRMQQLDKLQRRKRKSQEMKIENLLTMN